MGFVGVVDDDIPVVDQRHHIDSKLMIKVLISIFIVVFLVTILRMYIKCLVRRRPALGRGTSYTARNSRNSSGLDSSVITSLPIFLYKKNDPHEIKECSICLSTIEDGELVRILPNCNHNFHVECIDKWFNCNLTCPICRTKLEPRLLPEPREGVASHMTPSTPTIQNGNLSIVVSHEGTSTSGNGASSRLSSFKRIILSRERSSQRLQTQSCSSEDHVDDLESGGSRI
ncbi:unnamed protein product [Withania somnifera]